MTRPPHTAGLRHVALFVERFEETVSFYTELLGMKIEWQPDLDNIYLTSGNDNLALHRAAPGQTSKTHQKLDHLGFIFKTKADVEAWHAFLTAHQVPISKAPKTHRDGAHSFYCQDPDGNSLQFLYHPPLADTA